MSTTTRTRICVDADRAGSSAMVSETTLCAFQSPIRTAAKGTPARSRGIQSIDRFRSCLTSRALPGSISARISAGKHPGVRIEHPPRRIMGGKRPDENETGEEPQPVPPRVEGARQDAEGHVGEEVARLGRHEEQEGPREHAREADPAGEENPRDPERVCPPAHDGVAPQSPISRGSRASGSIRPTGQAKSSGSTARRSPISLELCVLLYHGTAWKGRDGRHMALAATNSVLDLRDFISPSRDVAR